jgi:hypothetical protein
MNLYRLKSNPTTIVKKNGIFQQIVWSDTMENGYGDSSWMISRWLPYNTTMLTPQEKKTVLQKIKDFKK